MCLALFQAFNTMVRLSSIISFVSLALLASATPVKRTQAKIEQDLTRVDTLVTAWDNAVNAFRGNANQANALHNAAVQLNSAINQATTDTKATALLTTDMATLQILGVFENASPTLVGGLTQISEKSKSFAAIRGATAVVEQDVRTLSTSTAALLTAISAISPAEVVPQASQFAVTLNDAYADTLTNLAKSCNTYKACYCFAGVIQEHWSGVTEFSSLLLLLRPYDGSNRLIALPRFYLATPVKRDMATIQKDITNISALLVTWDNAVNSFNGNTNSANTLHTRSKALESAFASAITDTHATSNFTSDTNALTVLGQMENSSPILVGGLTQIAEKSADFKKINGTSAIVADLGSLGAAATGFIGAIAAIITDTGVIAQATQFKTTWAAAFGDAISDLQSGL
ncbi:hypothetical protein D9757_012474 [Collybiopsis confluens]|uniref:Uncharacterized protein n=1 Tax=Collybiopsis confluens TaxID=2823264 RepID=A0A8H5G183_9AGAR|nr:hypothetical protein D9757_012474 [Collybiopsis confluens]